MRQDGKGSRKGERKYIYEERKRKKGEKIIEKYMEGMSGRRIKEQNFWGRGERRREEGKEKDGKGREGK